MAVAMNDRSDFERSPYLEMHLNDRVKWNVWSKEVIDRAKERDLPIFVSIGYSSCHWCHVMEEQTFNNEEVAKILNERFLPIIIDREERPDIDSFYMKISQIVNGTGGWPLNVVAMPDGKPFFVSTFLPPHGTEAEPGLFEILSSLSQIWKEERGRIVEASTQIMSMALGKRRAVRGSMDFRQYFETLASIYDRRNGGFGEAPKFPNFTYILFLLRYSRVFGNGAAIPMVGKTVDSIKFGGIYDHLAGGIHRYSTDAEWRVPHFEKMLYDQAMWIEILVQFYEITQEKKYLDYAKETVEFLFNSMQKDGLFVSALDADFKGEEGLYYVWDYQELKNELSEEEFNIFVNNFDTSNTLDRKVVLKRKERKLDPEEEASLSRILQKLRKIRDKRGLLRVDDKIILSWNCMSLSAILHYSIYDGSFRERALEKVTRLGSYFVTEKEIYRTVRNGGKGVPGMLEDYVYYAELLLNAFEITLDRAFLNDSIKVTEMIRRGFFDKEKGGFFVSPVSSDIPVVREKGEIDSVYPSGTSVLYDLLQKLSLLMDILEMKDIAASIGRDQEDELVGNPIGHISLVSFLMMSEMMIRVEIPDSLKRGFIDSRKPLYIPEVLFCNGKDAVNICNSNSCLKEISTLEEMWVALKSPIIIKNTDKS